MSKRPDYVATLETANVFSVGGVGVAAIPRPEYEAYQAALADQAAAIPHLEHIFANGSPVGRLYAGLGLYALCVDRRDELLATLEADHSPIACMSGCTGYPSTIGQTASELLTTQPADHNVSWLGAAAVFGGPVVLFLVVYYLLLR